MVGGLLEDFLTGWRDPLSVNLLLSRLSPGWGSPPQTLSSSLYALANPFLAFLGQTPIPRGSIRALNLIPYMVPAFLLGETGIPLPSTEHLGVCEPADLQQGEPQRSLFPSGSPSLAAHPYQSYKYRSPLSWVTHLST